LQGIEINLDIQMLGRMQPPRAAGLHGLEFLFQLAAPISKMISPGNPHVLRQTRVVYFPVRAKWLFGTSLRTDVVEPRPVT
jgi:hypothetical protein